MALKTASISQCKYLSVACKSKGRPISIGEWDLREKGDNLEFLSASILQSKDLKNDIFMNSSSGSNVFLLLINHKINTN